MHCIHTCTHTHTHTHTQFTKHQTPHTIQCAYYNQSGSYPFGPSMSLPSGLWFRLGRWRAVRTILFVLFNAGRSPVSSEPGEPRSIENEYKPAGPQWHRACSARTQHRSKSATIRRRPLRTFGPIIRISRQHVSQVQLPSNVEGRSHRRGDLGDNCHADS